MDSKITVALIGLGVAISITTQAAEPLILTDLQMDEITAGLADLQPTSITFAAALAGAAVDRINFFDSGIYNAGDTDSGVFNIKWFVGLAAGPGLGEQLGYGSHAGVPAGQTIMDGNSQFWWTPRSPGNYKVTFIVDADNHVQESNESNNSTTFYTYATRQSP